MYLYGLQALQVCVHRAALPSHSQQTANTVTAADTPGHAASTKQLSVAVPAPAALLAAQLQQAADHGIVCHDIDVVELKDGALLVAHPSQLQVCWQ